MGCSNRKPEKTEPILSASVKQAVNQVA